MMPAPVPQRSVIHLGDREYKRLQEVHDTCLDQAITLPDPEPALREDAKAAGQRAIEAAARLRGWVPRETDQRGGNFLYDWAEGETATTLVGRHWEIPYTFSDKVDAGGDLHVRPGYDLEVKRRRMFLTLNEAEMKNLREKPAIRFIVLVQQRTKTDPYLLCGVITPAAFFERAFARLPLQIDERVLRFVHAGELLEPRHFDPWRYW